MTPFLLPLLRSRCLARPTGKQTNLAGQTVIGWVCWAWPVLLSDWLGVKTSEVARVSPESPSQVDSVAW